MVTAIVIIDADSGSIPEVAKTIAGIDGVAETFSVTGDIDIVALVRVNHYDDLADVISDRIAKTPGVLRTKTHLAFQTFSQSDLDEAFALGLD